MIISILTEKEAAAVVALNEKIDATLLRLDDIRNGRCERIAMDVPKQIRRWERRVADLCARRDAILQGDLFT